MQKPTSTLSFAKVRLDIKYEIILVLAKRLISLLILKTNYLPYNFSLGYDKNTF